MVYNSRPLEREDRINLTMALVFNLFKKTWAKATGNLVGNKIAEKL